MMMLRFCTINLTVGLLKEFQTRFDRLFLKLRLYKNSLYFLICVLFLKVLNHGLVKCIFSFLFLTHCNPFYGTSEGLQYLKRDLEKKISRSSIVFW